MLAPFATAAARRLEESHQLAHLNRNAQSSVSSMDDANYVDSSISAQRIPGEEFGDDDIDAFIAENEGSRYLTQGECRDSISSSCTSFRNLYKQHILACAWPHHSFFLEFSTTFSTSSSSRPRWISYLHRLPRASWHSSTSFLR